MNKSNLIIIAEDDDEIAAILTGYLHRAGMKTCRAEDGEQAINLTRLHKPDLVLLDIHLPVYDGWNVLTTLRKETNVPVIMVTALDHEEFLKRLHTDGLANPVPTYRMFDAEMDVDGMGCHGACGRRYRNAAVQGLSGHGSSDLQYPRRRWRETDSYGRYR